MILSKITKIKLDRLGVEIVYLFGSRADGTAFEKSDYDVGVVFGDYKKISSNDLDIFNRIYQILSNDFSEKINGPKLDISFLQKSNAALEMAAIQDGKVLYEKNPVFRANYEESVVNRYDDYQSLKKEYEDATFTAFAS